MKKSINIRIDETMLSDFDSYAHELEAGKLELYTLEEVAQRLGLN